MKIIFLLILLVGCTSLRRERLTLDEKISEVGSSQKGFTTSKFICLSHIGTDCKWVPWSFRNKQKDIEKMLAKHNLKLVSGSYKEKPQGIRWYTIISLGLIPSEMRYHRVLDLNMINSRGKKYRLKMKQEYGIMAGWLSVFFGPLRNSSTIHNQQEKEFMMAFTENINKDRP